MNIHEHQAKDILREFGAPVSKGIVVFSVEEIKKNISKLSGSKFVLKAQIHAGGRGKAGGVKLIQNKSELETEANLMLNTLALLKTKNPSYKLEISKEVFPENWLPPIRNENALVNRRMNYLTNNE